MYIPVQLAYAKIQCTYNALRICYQPRPTNTGRIGDPSLSLAYLRKVRARHRVNGITVDSGWEAAR